MTPLNGMTKWFLRLGAIAVAAAAILALGSMLSSMSTAKVTAQVFRLEVAVNRLADVMEVGIAAIAEDDEKERQAAIYRLRHMRTVTGQIRIPQEANARDPKSAE